MAARFGNLSQRFRAERSKSSRDIESVTRLIGPAAMMLATLGRSVVSVWPPK